MRKSFERIEDIGKLKIIFKVAKKYPQLDRTQIQNYDDLKQKSICSSIWVRYFYIEIEGKHQWAYARRYILHYGLSFLDIDISNTPS